MAPSEKQWDLPGNSTLIKINFLKIPQIENQTIFPQQLMFFFSGQHHKEVKQSMKPWEEARNVRASKVVDFHFILFLKQEMEIMFQTLTLDLASHISFPSW